MRHTLDAVEVYVQLIEREPALGALKQIVSPLGCLENLGGGFITTRSALIPRPFVMGTRDCSISATPPPGAGAVQVDHAQVLKFFGRGQQLFCKVWWHESKILIVCHRRTS